MAFLTSKPVFPQMSIFSVEWQVSRNITAKKTIFELVPEIIIGPPMKMSGKIRAIVSVKNDFAKPAEGIVVRYSLSLLLAKKGTGNGTWMAPFHLEELRISKIKPGQIYKIKIIHADLNSQLKKIKESGFQASALKLQVMVEPRPGDSLEKNVQESVIPVVYR
ncbi:MAG: hypothetical protein HY746_04175 [Elusimicrobia bacterium]|nr:hypothetical protein [Elusimicrobiota bacterium]